MCIYIISDDIYFVAGLTYFLTANGIVTRGFSYESWLSDLPPGELTKEDTVIIDVNFNKCHRKLGMAKKIDYVGVNIVFIVDLPLQNEHKGFHPYWLISKKSAFKKYLPLLKAIPDSENLHCNQLSRKETLILKELASGNSAIFISRKLNISVKTISSHKQNAVRKLGMVKMNDMALICYKEILGLYSGFNNSYRGIREPPSWRPPAPVVDRLR